jgi:hypothetical protein
MKLVFGVYIKSSQGNFNVNATLPFSKKGFSNTKNFSHHRRLFCSLVNRAFLVG